MCPFFFFTFILSILLLVVQITAAVISVTFDPVTVNKLHEGKTQLVNFTIKWQQESATKASLQQYNPLIGSYNFYVDQPDVADVQNKFFDIKSNDLTANGTEYHSSFEIEAKFLGYSRVEIRSQTEQESKVIVCDSKKSTQSSCQLVVSVVRDKDFMQKVFVYSVAIIVSLSYINMGCALDTSEVYLVLRRPIAPAIGLFSQYVAMPLLSFVLAWLLFDETYLKLGLFIFGCSPGGGASNMWAVLLGGNLNLSITMTFLSTLLSFGLMPFWLYTLGRTIYEGTNIDPPVRSIFTTLGSMLIFLGIGLLIKRFFPQTAKICRRILAPFSVAMIVFIIVFGTYTNLYMFKVMNWRILLATACNVWSGMCIGFGLAFVFRKSLEDVIAISIETGVQNTGVSIVVLGLSLIQPDSDLASAVPVAASIMTPIPLTLAYLGLLLNRCYKRRHGKLMTKLAGSESYEQCNGKSPEIATNSELGISNVTMNEGHTDTEFDSGSGSSTRTSNSNLIKA